MKKLIILTLFAVLTCCERNEPAQPAEALEFFNSTDFKLQKYFLSQYGTIGTATVTDGIIQIPIGINTLQAMKTKSGMYFINLIILENWNVKTLSGTVRMVCLNNDNFEHTVLTVSNNIVLAVVSKETEAKGTLREFLACYHRIAEYYDNNDLLHYVCDWESAICAASGTLVCLITKNQF